MYVRDGGVEGDGAVSRLYFGGMLKSRFGIVVLDAASKQKSSALPTFPD